MTDKKTSKPGHKVGQLVDVKKSVTRPDGAELTVSGGQYVLTQAGTYLIDGNEIEVKS